MDNFYEQLVSAEASPKYKIAKGLSYGFVGFGFLLSIIGQIVLSILFLALGAALFFYKKNFFVEYEYVFTNGEIDVDKIFEMKSRKRVMSFSIKEVELLAPAQSDLSKSFPSKPERILSFYPENTKAKIYTAFLTKGSERAQIRFTPDEKFIECCFKYNPKAVKKNI